MFLLACTIYSSDDVYLQAHRMLTSMGVLAAALLKVFPRPQSVMRLQRRSGSAWATGEATTTVATVRSGSSWGCRTGTTITGAPCTTHNQSASCRSMCWAACVPSATRPWLLRPSASRLDARSRSACRTPSSARSAACSRTLSSTPLSQRRPAPLGSRASPLRRSVTRPRPRSASACTVPGRAATTAATVQNGTVGRASKIRTSIMHPTSRVPHQSVLLFRRLSRRPARR
mmetsp:Transcript_48112/g.129685  ORF Transcript_48112/g.129685 Transcript_48112/m.129685 type:complete len:230 (-) Transcript_48112:1138-1827(-)